MSGWKTVDVGTVRLIHHSTSSLVQMIVTEVQETSPGVHEEVSTDFWFDYQTFPDLREAINKTNFP
jgi:hypothetical protein